MINLDSAIIVPLVLHDAFQWSFLPHLAWIGNGVYYEIRHGLEVTRAVVRDKCLILRFSFFHLAVILVASRWLGCEHSRTSGMR